MARNVPMSALITALRAEMGMTMLPNVGTDVIPELRALLAGIQQDLALAYDWQHLNTNVEVPLSTTTRYHAMPTTIDFATVGRAQIRQGGRLYEIERGIYPEMMVDSDSSTGATRWPVERWDISCPAGSSTDQIEVWPIIPSGYNGAKLVLQGKRPLRAFAADDDLCDLDDRLIVLYAAGRRLARDKESREAGVVQKMAEARLRSLLTAQGQSGRQIIVGGGVPEEEYGIHNLRVR